MKNFIIYILLEIHIDGETKVASMVRQYTPYDFVQNSLTGFWANLLVGEYPHGNNIICLFSACNSL